MSQEKAAGLAATHEINTDKETAVEMSKLMAEALQLIGNGLSRNMRHDSGYGQSVEEFIDADGPFKCTKSTHTSFTVQLDSHMPVNTVTPPTYSLPLESMTVEPQPVSVPSLPAQEWSSLDVTNELHYDADSAYDGDSVNNDDTASLKSFVTNYRWENGRRYHAYSDGAYWVWPPEQFTMS